MVEKSLEECETLDKIISWLDRNGGHVVTEEQEKATKKALGRAWELGNECEV